VNARTRGAAAVAGGVVLGVVAVVVGRASGFDLPWPVAVPAGLAAGLLVAVALRVPHLEPARLEPQVEDRTASAVPLADLSGLHFAVRGAGGDPARFEQRIRPRMCAVAVDRLWQRHGLDWRTDAGREAARAVLGPLTWSLLSDPPHTVRLTPQTLSAWLDEVETL
jgi:hypothetical protein